jgi:hypothetical protein
VSDLGSGNDSYVMAMVVLAAIFLPANPEQRGSPTNEYVHAA